MDISEDEETTEVTKVSKTLQPGQAASQQLSLASSIRLSLTLFVEVLAVAAALGFLVGRRFAVAFYSHFSLTPSEVGLSTAEIAVIAVPLWILAALVVWVVSVVLIILHKRHDRPPNPGLTLILVGLILVGALLTVYGRVTPWLAEKAVDAVEKGRTIPVMWLDSPPSARLVADGSDDRSSECMVLMATVNDTWVLWSSERNELARVAVGDGRTLVSCKR